MRHNERNGGFLPSSTGNYLCQNAWSGLVWPLKGEGSVPFGKSSCAAHLSRFKTPAFLMREKVRFCDILALHHLLSVPNSFSVRCNFKGKTRWDLIFWFMPCAGWSARTKERTWVGFKREEISCHNNGRRCRFRYLFITTLIIFTSRQWRDRAVCCQCFCLGQDGERTAAASEGKPPFRLNYECICFLFIV